MTYEYLEYLILKYYPYRLQVLYNDKVFKFDNVETYPVIDDCGEYVCDANRTMLDKENIPVWATKPLLRPLEYLTKEIDLHGYKFIPILIIFNLKKSQVIGFSFNNISKGVYEIGVTYKDNGAISQKSLLINNDEIDISYNIISSLFSWHFDVYGLIDEGKAVDTYKTIKI